tara:strand:- start:47443 stop:47616 length:174 start_codon:yes stop_codon:yes gene_type:complete
MNTVEVGSIILINLAEFKVVGVQSPRSLEIVSTEPVPEGFKPKVQYIDVNQIDKVVK